MRKYFGTVYVFDFDDTLVWSKDWYDATPMLSNGIITGPGESGTLRVAFDLINKIKGMNVPERFKDMKLRIDESTQLNGRDIYFILLDANNKPILKEEILPFVSESELDDAYLEGPSVYSQYLAVIGDDNYYKNPKTLGGIGYNKEIMNIYREHRDNSIVLTARATIPGMQDTISKILTEFGGGPPTLILTRTPGESSTEHKGSAILALAKQDTVNSIHFWDDNLEYIMGVQKYLDDYDSSQGTNMISKVKIHHVGVSKPASNLISVYKMIKLANTLDSFGMFGEADKVDNHARDIVNVNKGP